MYIGAKQKQKKKKREDWRADKRVGKAKNKQPIQDRSDGSKKGKYGNNEKETLNGHSLSRKQIYSKQWKKKRDTLPIIEKALQWGDRYICKKKRN